MAEYLLSPAAEQDMENIFDYTVEQWGFDQAMIYFDHLIVAFQKLADTPQIAIDSRYIRKDYFRYLVEHHVVYFRLYPNHITIIRILHERMNPTLQL